MKTEKLNELKTLVAEILEMEVSELTDTGHLINDHGADSMRTIEILDSLERTYQIEIPQEELPKMVSMVEIYNVVNNYVKWE